MKNHLRNFRGCVGVAAAASLIGVIAVAVVQAQPPRGDRDGQSAGGVDAAVNRLMAYDADKDGKLSKAEVTDSRLVPLWLRCDANNDGVVTKDELTAQLGKEAGPANRAGNPPPGNGPGPGGLGGGPPGRGPGGPPPAPGQILPPFVQDELKLTEAQRTQLQELQKEVDARLAKILTSEQLQQLQQPRGRGPGGPGAGPGPGPGGRPPRQ